MASKLDLESTFKTIEEKILGSCRRSLRPRREICLVAVSKGKPASLIRKAYELGQKVFGENYVQEWKEKADELSDLQDLKWHFQGPIQSNKVKSLVGVVELIHSVDRLKIAQAINKAAEEKGVRQKVLLQLKMGGEETKHGIDPEEMPDVFPDYVMLKNLEIKGLMVIPPADPTQKIVRTHFKKLKEIAKEFKLEYCSMGMSQDFEAAIEEGATHIRIGTSLFGERR